MNAPQAIAEEPPQGESIEPELLKLLDHRYGDGLVYLREDEERGLLARAIRLGLVSPDGYITPKGQSAIAHATTG